MCLLNVCRMLLALQSLHLLAITTQAEDVYISEVLADLAPGFDGYANGDGKRHSYQDEFVELFYPSADTTSLAGWGLYDDETPWNQAFVFPPHTVLPPASHIVLFGISEPADQGAQTFVDDGRIENVLSNKGKYEKRA